MLCSEIGKVIWNIETEETEYVSLLKLEDCAFTEILILCPLIII